MIRRASLRGGIQFSVDNGKASESVLTKAESFCFNCPYEECISHRHHLCEAYIKNKEKVGEEKKHNITVK